MDRGYGSGFSSWGGGGGSSSRAGTHADVVIAKINQRLDMLTQFEGGMKGSRSDRYDQYESFDSRASSRDLYSNYGYDRGDNLLFGHRGGSGFGGGMGLGGGGFDSLSSSYAKMRQNMRDSYSSGQGGGSGGGGWAGAGRRSPRRGGNTRGRGFGSHRSDPAPLGGGRGSGSGGQSHRGHSSGGGYGRGKLPSLLSNRMYPESGGFHQGSIQDFPRRHFGGAPRAGHQRGRKRPLSKQVKPQRPEVQKKRKQMLTAADEPESKINKTEDEGSEAIEEKAEKNGDSSETKAAAEETKPAEEGEDTKQKGNQTPVQTPDKRQKMKKRMSFVERGMYACSVCRFRSFYKDEMDAHLESRFHKDHFRFLSSQLSKPTADFLQDYLLNKFKKLENRASQMENQSAAICQFYKEQDLTRELGMEHFMRKVEAAHCAACDLFIPMQPHLIQKHIRSHDHNYNRKGMMEQSKRASVSVARSILNHKFISKKLDLYLKGQNPFTGPSDEQDPEDSMVMDVSELELTSEAADGQTETTENKEESAVKEDKDQEEAEAEEAAVTGDAAETAEQDDEQMLAEEEEEHEITGEEEGFEVGEDEEEESYVVHDEVGEDEWLDEEAEGAETVEAEGEEKDQE